jgi:hypothetical protein
MLWHHSTVFPDAEGERRTESPIVEKSSLLHDLAEWSRLSCCGFGFAEVKNQFRHYLRP